MTGTRKINMQALFLCYALKLFSYQSTFPICCTADQLHVPELALFNCRLYVNIWLDICQHMILHKYVNICLCILLHMLQRAFPGLFSVYNVRDALTVIFFTIDFKRVFSAFCNVVVSYAIRADLFLHRIFMRSTACGL